MSRPKKISLILLAIILAAICCAIPFSLKPIALYWAKHKAHQIFAKWTPEEMRDMNAVPLLIILPKPFQNPPMPASLELPPYIFRFQPPQSHEIQGRSLVLIYPTFKVRFLLPHSDRKIDAELLSLIHEDLFQREAEVARARPDEIDAQPDLKSLANLSTLLSEKVTGFALSNYYAQFNQDGRRGFIRATYPIHYQGSAFDQYHAVIYFSPAQISCGMYFSSDKKINPADIQSFLSTLQIEPSPASTLPATQP